MLPTSVWQGMPEGEPRDLEQLLDRLEEQVRGQDTVSLGDLLDAVGRRSFGPLLLVVGLLALSPLSGIPGMPTTLGVLVLLLAGQMLARRRRFWLPGWILRRRLRRSKFEAAVRFLRRPAHWVDRVLRERWVALTEGVATYGIAIVCALIAATMPPLELVPFAASTAGAALSIFGVALIARDGLMAALALLFVAVTGVLVAMQLL